MTLGPFFPREFAAGANDLAAGAQGEAIEITGRVAQADGRPLDNLVLEIWQADAQGRFDDPEFLGWGRAATDAEGIYRFKTVKPGASKAGRRISTSCCSIPVSCASSTPSCSSMTRPTRCSTP
jgi:protocatechuate 3,4-dioxygenase beta subunit